LAGREQYLRRAVFAAHLRGELSTDHLFDALAHRNGFDSRRHPSEQEAMLRRLGCEQRLREYRTAVAAERAAWHDAGVAAAAKRSLYDEAFAAAARARAAHHQRATLPRPRREVRDRRTAPELRLAA
jgi:hypothetical protein